MAIHLDLSNSLQSRVNEEAAKAGMPPEQFVVSALSRFLQVEPNVSIATEDELLEFITSGLSENDWQHYDSLVAKRQQEQISTSELEELTRLTDRLEHLNAARMKCLVELAARRGCSMEAVMQQLGIDARLHQRGGKQFCV